MSIYLTMQHTKYSILVTSTFQVQLAILTTIDKYTLSYVGPPHPYGSNQPKNVLGRPLIVVQSYVTNLY